MKNSVYGALALAFASTAALTSCQNDDIAQEQGEVRHVKMSVSLGFNPDQTRTTLTEVDGDLKCTWNDGDKVWVMDVEGHKLGELTILDGYDGKEYAKFDGDLIINDPDMTQVSFVYFGSNVNPDEVEVVNSTGEKSWQFNFANEGGTLESLSEQDFLWNTTNIEIMGGTAYTAEMGLKRKISFGHFELQFPDGVSRTDEPVTVSGDGVRNYYRLRQDLGGHNTSGFATITVGGYGNDLYMTIIPSDPNTIEPTFSVTIDGKTYTGSLAPRVWTASEYVRKGHGEGVPVVMTAEGDDDAADDMVGPEIEINGKKYRFTRGNLKYNTKTGVWTILDEQTYFVNAGGLGTQESLSVSTLGTTPEEIGLFGWGATGLEDARSPWYICKIIYAGGTAMEATGAYWPSTDYSKNSTIKNLWDNDFVYDWGRAYMENGRAADDNRQYVTPPQSAFITLFNNSFVQGCTIKGAGINGEDVTGLICIPGIGKEALADAKAFINSVEGASCLSSMKNVIHNNNGNTLSYKNITLTGVDVLRKLNDAVFFPAASKRNLSSGKVYNSNGNGWYWTANGSTTNAYDLFFNGTAGGFFYSGSSTSASTGRFNQMAVRLMVEVK